MSESALSLTAMAETLTRSGDYRVLRRLVPRTALTSAIGQATKTGLLIDVETTGLDHRKDEIIELGMVKFDYLPDGRIVGLRDVFASFNEPSGPVPQEIVTLTGITDEIIVGHRIDDSAVVRLRRRRRNRHCS
jgi:DNA polymerase-3 subunit epsilon